MNDRLEAADPGMEDLVLPDQPYPGLRPFTGQEWVIFFGRESMTQDVVSRLVAKQLVAVHGDSGCGKSSLIAAGVMPFLEHDQARAGGKWTTTIMRPEENPLGNLAAALAGPQGRIDPTRVLEIRRLLNRGADAPAAVAKYLGCDAENNVCVLFDQFEELFEHARRGGGTEATLITDFLVGLAAKRPKGLHAILTMRSDYLGQCAQYRGFAEAVNETQYLVPRMERPALMRAIREPAALYGGSVDAGPRRAADRRRRRRPGPAAADPARADADVAQGGSGGCTADADAAGLSGRRRSCRATVPPRRRDDGRGHRRA